MLPTLPNVKQTRILLRFHRILRAGCAVLLAVMSMGIAPAPHARASAPSTPLVLAPAAKQPQGGAKSLYKPARAPLAQGGNVCFATPDNGTTVFSSTDFLAVQQAVDAASMNGTVKVAGTCAGVQARGGSTQTVILTKTLTLAGGFTNTNWTTPNTANVTVLDAVTQGRGIYATQPLTVSSLTVQNGNPSGAGGGVLANSTLVLSDTHFLSNTAQIGGGAYAGGAVTLNGGSFQNNTSTSNSVGGGGLYANSTLALTGTRFLSNTAQLGGGGVSAGGAVTLTGGLFQNNRSTSSNAGGGLAVYNSTLVLSGTQFISNTAAGDGGGVYAQGAATLNGGLFISNTAGQSGGGLRADNALAITDTRFINNTSQANRGGGLFHQGSGNGLVVNTLFARNRAGNTRGTAASFASAGTVNVIHTTVASPTLLNGSAFFVSNGTVNLTNTLISSHTVGIERVASTVREDYTLFSGVNTPYSGTVTSGGNSITGTAGFVDPTNDDYSLTAASSAIDAGTNAGINTDFFGNARPQGADFDIGFDEFTPPPNVCFATPNNGTTVFSSTDFLAVQQAVDAASANGTVKVAGYCAGVQTRASTTQTVVITKALTLAGGFTNTVGGWTTAYPITQPTTLDAQTQGRVISATQPITVSNLTAQRGSTTGNGGGAWFGSSAILSGTDFISNTANLGGGGAWFANTATLNGGIFLNNRSTTSSGGGLSANSTLALTGTQFISNTASTLGGALYHTTGSGRVVNALFARNGAGNARGMAAYFNGSNTVNVIHTTVASPTQSNGSALFVNAGTVIITNTLISSHTVGIERAGGTVRQNFNLFSGVTTPYSGTITGGANSITGTAGFVDPALDNYHIITPSAAVDAGTNVGINVDIDGDFRPQGASFDIGFDEFVAPATCFATHNDGITVFSNSNAYPVQQAVDAASAGGTVKVAGTCAGVQTRVGTTQTVVITKALTLAGGFTNTIGGWATSDPIANPTTLDALAGGRVISATQPVTMSNLTAQNGRFSGNGGGVYFTGPAVISGVAFRNNTAFGDNPLTGFGYDGGGAYFSSTAVISGVTFSNNGATGFYSKGGGAVFNSTATLTSTTFTSNTANSSGSSGGGAYFNAGATLTSTDFISNSTGGIGGGGASFVGTAALTNTTFTSNTAMGDGGGALFKGTATLVDAAFISNTANNGGGAQFQGAATLVDTTFISNSVGNNGSGGGAMFLDFARVTEATFTSNSAGYGGGGAYFYTTTILSSLDFTNNSAGSIGGGAGFQGISTLTGTTFTGNTAGLQGGGLWFGSIDNTITLTRTTFIRNAADYGGGAYNYNAAVLTGTTFISNTAIQDGGGALFYHGAALTNTLFIANTASQGGGAYFEDNPTPRSLVNTLFARNRASNGAGAAIYSEYANPLNIVHTTISSPTLTGGSAIAVYNGSANITNTLIASHTIGIENTWGTVSENYTLFSGVSTPYSGTITSGDNSITGTAGFINAANDNYRILNTSSAVNAGMNAGVSTDFDGNARPFGAGFDIGAFEAQSNPPAAAACFATPDNGTTVFSTANADAVQQAVDGANAGDTVKVAGTCAGVQVRAGTTQTVYISKALTLAGGFTTTNWSTYNSAGNPTTLDALRQGRVISASVAATLMGFTATNGYLASDSPLNGGGIFAGAAMTLTDMRVVSNTVINVGLNGGDKRGGGAYIAGAALVTNSTFISNTAHSTGVADNRGGGGLWVGGTASVTGSTFISNVTYVFGAGAYFDSAATVVNSTFRNNRTTHFLVGGGAGATFNITSTVIGSTFDGNFVNNGGAGALFNAGAVITDSTFSNNNAEGPGGGIYVTGGATITGSAFLTNSAYSFGGGAYLAGDATLTGTTFSRNLANVYDGGGAFVGGAATLNSVSFLTNTAARSGGGAAFSLVSSVSTSTFNGNRSNGSGGGALFASSAPAAITNTTFFNNSTLNNGTQGGGAIFNSTASITNSTFLSNSARADGAGGYFAQSAIIANSNFVSNTAGSSSGGAYFSSIATLNGTTFTSNTASAGNAGGAWFGGTSTLTGTVFTSNTASQNGGGAHFGSTTIITNASFAGNRSNTNIGGGGGAFFFSLASLAGTTFISNTAAADGGGARFNSSVTLAGTAFISNTASNAGGARFSSSATLAGTAFTGNTATQFGGGALFNGINALTGVTFTRNTASSSGGAHFNNTAPATLTGASFISNTANGGGGGGGAVFNGTAVLASTFFTGNTASGGSGSNGGGAYFIITATLTGTTFTGNTASNGGGAWFNSTATLTSTTFISNTAGNGSGAYFTGATPKSLVNVLFARNAVSGTLGRGAAVFVDGNSLLDIVHTTVASPTLVSGSAIYVLVGTVNLTNTLISSHTVGINNAAGGTVSEDYTLFSGVTTPTLGTVNSGGNSITGTAGFVNPTNNNYRLADGSIGIDAGTDAGITADFFGNARPLGNGFDIGYAETIPTLAEVGLMKTASAASMALDGAITFTLAFSNAGSDIARNIIVRDTLPPSLTLSSWTSSTTGMAITQSSGLPNLAWRIGDMDAGDIGIITLTAITRNSLNALGTLTNTATIAADNDVITSNNRSSVVVTITGTPTAGFSFSPSPSPLASQNSLFDLFTREYSFNEVFFTGIYTLSVPKSQVYIDVALNTQPTSTVTLPLSSTNTGEGTVEPSSLTFTPANWNVPQRVILSSVDDLYPYNYPIGTLPQFTRDVPNYTLVVSPAISLDPNYDGLDVPDFAATNIDNEIYSNYSAGGSWLDSNLAYDEVTYDNRANTTTQRFRFTQSPDPANTFALCAPVLFSNVKQTLILQNGTVISGAYGTSPLSITGPYFTNIQTVTGNAEMVITYPGVRPLQTSQLRMRYNSGTIIAPNATSLGCTINPPSQDFSLIDSPPAGNDDIYAANNTQHLVVAGPQGVLANDAASGEDTRYRPLRALLVTPPSTGQVNLMPDGAFTYTPSLGYVGTVTFSYLASQNELLELVTTTVTLNVTNGPLTVTNTNDDGPGSLRWMAASAALRAGANTISFDPALAGQVITLTTGQVIITGTVSVDASNLVTPVAVSGNDSTRIFSVTSPSAVTLTALVLQNGNAGEGGAIFNSGAMNLVNMRLFNNNTTNGSAIYQAGGSTQMANSCVVGNSPAAVFFAGGTSPITATSNWWGSASGPSGAGPGVGDSVSSNVDFSGFLDAAVLGCPALPIPDVAISKSVTPSSGLAGSAITYTLSFSNVGPGSAGGIVITDSVPASITINSVSSSGAAITQTSGAPDFAWQVSNLAPNAGGVIMLTGVVSTVASDGVITNTAVITAGGDGNSANNSASAGFTVTAPLVAAVCFAEINGDNTTDFSSADASAVRQAVDAVTAIGTVKVAGTCANATFHLGYPQVVQITQTLTLIGGYTATNWLAASDPIAHPTTLDALGQGRVIYATAPVTIANLIAQNGNDSAGAGGWFQTTATVTGTTFISNTAANAGGAYFNGPARVFNSAFISNTATNSGGGAAFQSTDAVVSGTRFVSNTATQSGGGAVFVGTVVLTGTTFIHNTAGQYAGGAAFSVANAQIVRSQFMSNTTGLRGGGLMLSGSFAQLVDTDITGNATFSDSEPEAGGGGLWSNGPITQTGGRIAGNTSAYNGGGPLVMDAAAVFSGTQFISNTATNSGGGAYFQGTATLTDTAFTSNIAAIGGGAWFDSIATLTGTAFISNTSNQYGGGAVFGGFATLTGATFTSNMAATQDGGGAFFGSSATLANTTFTSNTAAHLYGGGAYFARATLLAGTTFISNTALQGGGAYFESTATLTNTTFTRNTAGSSGGGAFLNGAATMSGTSFINNAAFVSGGGALFQSSSVLTQATFVSNTALQGGGAWFSNSAPAVLMGGSFIGNQAEGVGGALFGSSVVMSGTTFDGNSASSGGAGGVSVRGAATLTGTTFSSNRASNEGGGAYFRGATTLIGATFISNTAGDDGGGAWFESNAGVTGTTFAANTAGNHGGGAFVLLSSNINSRIVNSVFARNRAGDAGDALFFTEAGGGGAADVVFTTIASPTVTAGSAIFVNTGDVNITNTLISSYTVGISKTGTAVVNENFTLFSGVTTPYYGTVTSGGNSITGTAGFVNPAADDYQLTNTSSAIDAGTDAGISTDFFGNARPQGNSFDIGYSESPLTATADIAISKSVTPSSGLAGSAITYTLTFSNAGPGSAGGVVITDSVPASVTISSVSSSGAAITQTSGAPNYAWQASNLAPNAGGVITLTGTISTAAVAGTVITNTAGITSSGDSNATNNFAGVTTTVSAPAAPAVCFATPDNGTTVFSSSNFIAVQQAVDAASANGTVKVAGTCAGVQTRASTTQTVIITKALTLAGGFTNSPGGWAIAYPITQPTTLDAQTQGRVISATAAMTVSNLTVQNGNTLDLNDGGGAYFGNTATLIGTTFTSNTGGSGGGASFRSIAILTGTAFISNTTGGGGGGASFRSIAILTSTTFTRNTATNGGGAFFFSTAPAILTGTTFISNTATQIGGGALFNSSATLAGTSFISNTAGNTGGGAQFFSTATLTSTTFSSNTAINGGGAWFQNTATMTDTSFISNTVSQSGGGSRFEGPATLTGTVFISNTASQQGGGAYFGSTATLTGTAFISNAARRDAGGAYFQSTATLTSTTFTRNTASQQGGGAWFQSTATLSGTTFISNTANNSGGGAWFQSTATLVGTAFSSNRANVDGGGAWFGNTAGLTGTAFISNTATRNAGGAYFNSTATLAGMAFISNAANNGGGGAYFFSTTTLSGTAFTGNTAEYGGGAYFVSAAMLASTAFTRNTASQQGGGAYFQSTTTLAGTTFTGNAASLGGGALFLSTATLTGTTFISNTANNQGGGAFFTGATLKSLINVLFARNRANTGAAIYVENASPLNLVHTTVASPTLVNSSAIYVVTGTANLTNTLISSYTVGIENGTAVVNENYTLFSGVTTPYSGTVTSGGNSITGTAGFVDPANDDYHLTGSSSAVNTGTNAGITFDFDGNPRPIGAGFDIGAWEFDNGSPVANAGLPQTVTVGTLVTLTGAASSDPENGALIFGWSQLSGASVSLSDNTAMTPTFTAPATPGTLLFRLVVTDTAGEPSAPAFVTVTITNGQPVANAGAPQSVGVGTPVTLTGVASIDPDGHALTFGWSQTGGTPVALSSNSAGSPTFTAPGVTGELAFQLVVTDAFGLVSAPALVTVTVTNNAPVALATAPLTTTAGTVVTLDGSGSSDPDDHALSFGWTQTSGDAVALSNPTAVSPTFTAPITPGDLVFQLIVTDAFGLPSAPAWVTVTVQNRAPTANAGTPQSAVANALVTLDGSASSDPDGHALTFGWAQVSGTAVALSSNSAISPTFTSPAVVGDLVFQLIVTNAFNAVSTPAFVTVTVGNSKPIADAGAPQSVNGGVLVTLTGSASSDPENQALVYGWTQTSGAPVTLTDANGITPTFTAPVLTGTLVFQLVVTDALGLASNPAFVTVTVSNSVPVADAGAAQGVAAGAPVTLTGAASFDPDGDAIVLGWMQVSGTPVALSSNSAVSPTFTAPAITGTLVFQLVVTDVHGLVSAPAFVTITVNNNAPVANAGTPQTVTVGTPAMLDGSASSDSDNQALSYGWLQVSGTSVTLSDNNVMSPVFTAPNATGELVFQLIVTDTTNTPSAPAFVTVTVVNGQPVANAGMPQTAVVNSGVTLNGSTSSDPDNQPLSFGWSQVSGTPVLLSSDTAVSPTFSAPALTGDLVFQLIVTDAFGALSEPARVTVTVTNGEPIADAGAPQTVLANAPVTLDGSASSDPDNQTLTFGWSQVSGTPVMLSNNTAVLPAFTAPAITGTLIFQLVVTDSAGLSSAPAFVTVTVDAAQITTIPPEGAVITLTTGVAMLGPSTEFTAALDGGSEPITFTWDFGDGSPIYTGTTASHQYAPGVYTATLIATNSAGTVTTTIIVYVPWRVLIPIQLKDSTLPLRLQRR